METYEDSFGNVWDIFYDYEIHCWRAYGFVNVKDFLFFETTLDKLCNTIEFWSHIFNNDVF